MLGIYADQIHKLYDRADSILIIDQGGFVEYSATYDQEKEQISKDSYIGKHIFEVYPALTVETSTHYRVMESRQPIINEEQEITDFNGNKFSFINSSFPILFNETEPPLGTIELSILVSKNQQKKSSSAKDLISEGLHRETLYSVDSIITEDPVMEDIKDYILRFSGSTSNAMVWGETGTGKELIVESLHSLSPRKNAPFIIVNCSAMPSNLIEGILFGTTKGSFTGSQDKTGLIEMANGGTLFLDELNSMDISLQPKLLQVIERQKVRKIGDSKERPINVRFIAAMNTDPEKAIEDGILRRDLFYRLNILEFHVPPLRERKNDIPVLVDHFIRHCNESLGKNITSISPLAINTLMNYSYPGNVRELKNIVEYAINVASGSQITMQDLPSRVVRKTDDYKIDNTEPDTFVIPSGDFSLQKYLDDCEKAIITKVVKESKSITDAGRKLGLSRQALRYKLLKYGISD